MLGICVGYMCWVCTYVRQQLQVRSVLGKETEHGLLADGPVFNYWMKVLVVHLFGLKDIRVRVRVSVRVGG